MTHTPQSTLSDNELVAKSLEDINAFGELVDRYAKKLEAFVMRVSDVPLAEAEEIVQEVFVKAWKNIKDFDHRVQFSTWVYRIARNHTISWFRKKTSRGQHNKVELDEQLFNIADESFDITEEIDRSKRAEIVHTVLTKLPRKYKDILVLRYLEEKSYDEISDILKKPSGTVATLINRAKKAFKKILTRHYSLSQL